MSKSFRPRKLTTPTVPLCSSPSGVPIAHPPSPMRSVDESPSGATGSPLWPSTLINAMSVSGSAPMTRARKVRPSDSFTVIRSARSTTWWLVRMLPSASMMNPLPAPRRGVSLRGGPKAGPSSGAGLSGGPTRRGRRLGSRPRLVASMLTTAGLMRSTTSAKLSGGPSKAAGDGRTAYRPAGVVDAAGAPAVIVERAEPPDMIAPTRKATTAVSVTVTSVKRRDMECLAVHYKLLKRRLIEHLDAELARLLQLAAGVGSGHHRARLLAHRSRHPGTKRFERCRRVLTRHRRQRTGEDEGLASEPSHRLDGRFRQRRRHVDAGLLEVAHQLAVVRLLRKGTHRCRHHRTDLRHRLQRLYRRVEHRIHRPQVSRDRGGGLFADVPDPKRVNQPREVVRLAALNLLEHVPADLAKLARHSTVRFRVLRRHHQVLERRRLEVVEIGKIAHETLLDQLIDERRAEPLDVHSGSRGEVLETSPQPCRTRRVFTAPDDFLFVTAQRAAAFGTRRRHHPWLGIGGPQARDRRDHLGNDIAGLLDDDRVARAYVLAGDVLGVVQRGHRNRRAGDEDRLQHRVRRHRAGPADVDVDPQQLRVRLLRGKLEGRRPSGEIRRAAELLAQRQVVHLDDDSISVEVE